MAHKNKQKPTNHTEVANIMRQVITDFEDMAEELGKDPPTWSKAILQYVKKHSTGKKRDPLEERHAKLMRELKESKQLKNRYEFLRGEEYNKQIVITQKLGELGKKFEARERGETA